jgi:hypothetical protein
MQHTSATDLKSEHRVQEWVGRLSVKRAHAHMMLAHTGTG